MTTTVQRAAAAAKEIFRDAQLNKCEAYYGLDDAWEVLEQLGYLISKEQERVTELINEREAHRVP